MVAQAGAPRNGLLSVCLDLMPCMYIVSSWDSTPPCSLGSFQPANVYPHFNIIAYVDTMG